MSPQEGQVRKTQSRLAAWESLASFPYLSLETTVP